MAAPIQRDIYRPALEYAGEIGRAFSVKELKAALKSRMSLSQSDLEETTRGGRTSRFYKNVEYVDWKLKEACFLGVTVGGKEITEAGRALLQGEHGGFTSEEIQAEVTRRINVGKVQTNLNIDLDDFGADQPEPNGGYSVPVQTDSTQTESEGEILPEDLIQDGFRQLESKLTSDLGDMITRISSTRFEKLVIELLEAMGYGAGEHTGGPRDQGIDGVVRSDPLGLGTVYFIQAKQHSDNVGRDVVDQFAGTVDRFKAAGGVVATTAGFTQDGIAAAVGRPILLLDGSKMIELLIKHGVGVVTEYNLEVKKLDEDYFGEEI